MDTQTVIALQESGEEMKKKSTSFNLSITLMQRFKSACATRGTSMSDVLEESIQAFLDARPRGVSTPSAPENQHWHDKLEAVLAGGVHTAADLVQNAVQAGYELTECQKRLAKNKNFRVIG